MNNFNNDERDNENFNLREQLEKYLVHWRWFLFSVTICSLLAFSYLRFATPSYEAVATILIKTENKSGTLSDLLAFSNFSLGSNLKNSMDNEIEIFKSRSLIENTIKKMNLTVSFFNKENIVDRDIYAESPIKVTFLSKTNLFNEAQTVLKCQFRDSTSFSLKCEVKNQGRFILSNKKFFKFGEKIFTQIGVLIIERSPFYKIKSNHRFEPVYIHIDPLDVLVANVSKKLVVEPTTKNSSIVKISIDDPVAKKAEEFLNNLIKIYNENAIDDKSFIAENTSKFIASRLSLITKELNDVEQDVESFKKDNKLIDIESQSKLFLEGSNEYEKKEVETEIQLNVIASLLEFIRKSGNSDLLPTNIMSDKDAINSLIASYNQLILDRNQILKSATIENPSVIKLDGQINSLKSNVVESLKRIESDFQIQNRNVKTEADILKNKIGKIPVQEREFRVIARQQKVKEELYLYLLQKREESAISLVTTESNARIIDSAKADKTPISPRKKIICLAGLFLGVLIPFIVIYLIDLFDTKIRTRQDLEGKTQIPFIGDVPTCEDVKEIVKPGSRSSSAEAVRIIRTNLEFMLNSALEGTAKTIFLTSTFSSEGKTFLSVNLASVFSLSEKKVLLIGMDIRNPKFNEYFKVPTAGLTNYLAGSDKDIHDYIIKHKEYNNFFILPSGIIPPNPAELLMGKKVEQLFEQLKKEYDYIIVDTAPVSLVTDTLLIAKNADAFIFVIRANFLDKRMLTVANTLYKENKLPNMSIVLNDTDATKGYGYGTYLNKKPWYKKFFA